MRIPRTLEPESRLELALDAQSAELFTLHKKKLNAGLALADLVKETGTDLVVSRDIYHAFLYGNSLIEARDQSHSDYGSYQTTIGGLDSRATGKPVIVTRPNEWLIHRGRLADFSQSHPSPLRHVIGFENQNRLFGRVEVAMHEMPLSWDDPAEGELREKVSTVVVSDRSTKLPEDDGPRVITESLINTRVLFGEKAVRHWAEHQLTDEARIAASAILGAVAAK